MSGKIALLASALVASQAISGADAWDKFPVGMTWGVFLCVRAVHGHA